MVIVAPFSEQDYYPIGFPWVPISSQKEGRLREFESDKRVRGPKTADSFADVI